MNDHPTKIDPNRMALVERWRAGAEMLTRRADAEEAALRAERLHEIELWDELERALLAAIIPDEVIDHPTT